ncbi:MAG: hypothetical protein IPO90_13895 [Flavobacteriales bacterium]|nr:hypothetical protein [Flavobacteriales bacterium]
MSVFNKFDLVATPQHRLASLTARYVTEDRWGGQLQGTDADKERSRKWREHH